MQLENGKTETERLRYKEHRWTHEQETTQMQLEEAQSELQVERNKQTEFIQQRQNLLDALRQKRYGDADQDAGVDVLI